MNTSRLHKQVQLYPSARGRLQLLPQQGIAGVKKNVHYTELCYTEIRYQDSTVPLIHLGQKICKCGEIYLPPYMAQGVYSRFQVTGMMEWGQKSRHKKILWASNNSLKKNSWTNINPQKFPWQISEPFKFPESIKWYDTKNVVFNKFVCTLFAELCGQDMQAPPCFGYPRKYLLTL